MGSYLPDCCPEPDGAGHAFGRKRGRVRNVWGYVLHIYPQQHCPGWVSNTSN